jgi:hypothetical protein
MSNRFGWRFARAANNSFKADGFARRLTQALELMYRSTRLIALITSASLASAAFAGESAPIGVKELARSAAQFVGKPVTTHGCVVKHFHGSFVQPCGSRDWHELVLVLDPYYRVPAVFKRVGVDFTHEVEGDFSGFMVEVTVDHPKPHKRAYLRLDSVVNAKQYEP